MQGQLLLKKSEGFLKKKVWKPYWFKLSDQSFVCAKTEDYNDLEDTIKIEKGRYLLPSEYLAINSFNVKRFFDFFAFFL